MAAARSSRVRDYRWDYGKLIPRAVIRDYARQIAEQFHPDRIILFGSYAYGKPHKDSDVDILVVMQSRDEINQAVRILEGKDYLKHVGPALFVVDQANVKTFNTDSTLAPANFKPTFKVD